MKKPIMMALSLMLLSSLALAQTPSAPPAASKPAAPVGKVPPPPASQLKNDLELTDEQVKKMREIRDAGGSREDIQAVLTPEQKAKQAALRKAHKGERKERRAQMEKELGLTDEQKKKMAEIRKNNGTREEMRAVLTPEQQAKLDSMRSQRPEHGKHPHGAISGPAPAAKPAVAPAPTTAPKPAE